MNVHRCWIDTDQVRIHNATNKGQAVAVESDAVPLQLLLHLTVVQRPLPQDGCTVELDWPAVSLESELGCLY